MPPPPSEDAASLTDFTHVLADAAAAVTLRYFRGGGDATGALDVENKLNDGGFDPVTAADRGAEEAIRALIEGTYAGHGIIGEEFGNRSADGPFTWFLDPVDGTRQFVCGVPLWGTLIGLGKDGSPLIGMLDQPYLGERFWGSPQGAFLRNRNGTLPIRTSGCEALAEARLGTTSPFLFEDGAEARGFAAVQSAVRLSRYGGDCYFYGLVAAGHLDLVVESGLKAYDIFALIPIIEAAGGVVTTWDGGPVHGGGRVLAAATPALHAQAMEMLAR